MKISQSTVAQIREHKHNYSSEFGSVVMEPCRTLFKELLRNPGVFTSEEREEIVTLFKSSNRISSLYEILGLSSAQIDKRIETSLRPEMRKKLWSLQEEGMCTEIVSDGLGYPADSCLQIFFSSPQMQTRSKMLLVVESFSLYEELCTFLDNRSLTVQEQLANIDEQIIPYLRGLSEKYIHYCSKIETTEFDGGYKCAKTPYVDEFLVKTLQGANDRIDGLIEMLSNIRSEEFGVKEVFMIRTELRDSLYSVNKKKQIKGEPGWVFSINPGNAPYACVCLNRKSFEKKVLDNLFKNFDDHAFDDFELDKERKVTVSLSQDEDGSFVNVEIKNNGAEFNGDVNSVFDLGVGSGTGIGLCSAKKFLEKNGGSICMQTKPREDYPVSFLIKLPLCHERN